MYIKRFNEMVGFDDEETRDRLEIPNLRGELEPSSVSMKPYSKPFESETTETFVKKILYRYPVLDRFHGNIQKIDSTEVYNLYATSLEPKDEMEFYVQLSLAFNKGDYYCLAVLRGLEDFDDEDKWYKKDITVENVDDTFEFVDAFLKACKGLHIVDKSHLEEGRFRNN